MKFSEHADRTEQIVGIRAEDIHKWIDGFFDREGFDEFIRSGTRSKDYNPYSHRKHRHCIEALEDALKEFEGKYTPQQIRAVFETHIKDDYNGYIPHRADFENGTFKEKYHEDDEHHKQERIFSKAELSEYFQGKSYNAQQKETAPNRTTFNRQIVLPSVLAIALFIGSIFIIVVPAFHDNLMEEKKSTIKELTATSISLIEHYVQEAETGRLTLEEAQEKAKDMVSRLRYGSENKDYFWIIDRHPRMVMHPYRKDLTAVDLSEYRDVEDKSGKFIFKESVELVAEHQEGYLEYLWQWKDDPTRTVPKLSYVKGIPEWGWIIGTGVYINDVETEIEQLTNQLLFFIVWTSLGIILLLAYIIHQSKRIERNRRNAESGLLEAKERYRALVESSNEGYMLELNGEIVYSNPMLQRMLGYTEEALADPHIWNMLLPAQPFNDTAIENIHNLLNGQTTLSEFSAQLKRSNGSHLDVMIRTSRIFFSRKNGHVISFRPIIRNKSVTSMQQLSSILSESNDYTDHTLLDEIDKSQTPGQIIQALNQLPITIEKMTHVDINPHIIRELIAHTHNRTVCKLIELAMAEYGKPPVDFAFLSLGSTARNEMTLYSDQDNAIVFANDCHHDLENTRQYFLNFAENVCSKLNLAGFPFCPGGIMASNPKWCLSLDEWKEHLSQWITQATPETLMEVNIFFDMRVVYGEQALGNQLIDFMFEMTAKHPAFFIHYAQNCLYYKAPLNLFGQIKAERVAGARTLNIKECLTPLVLFARLYSLKHNCKRHSTLGRIIELQEQGILKETSCREIIQIFNEFWRLRFYNQIKAHDELKKENNEIDINSLTDLERQNLRNTLAALSVYQSKISYDFFGTSVK